jgi:hypothetical protein
VRARVENEHPSRSDGAARIEASRFLNFWFMAHFRGEISRPLQGLIVARPETQADLRRAHLAWAMESRPFEPQTIARSFMALGPRDWDKRRNFN